MKKNLAVVLWTILGTALSVGAFAQNYATFDQGLWLRYQRNQATGTDTADQEIAQYNFNLTMPAWTPRLGQVSVFGLLEWTRVAYGKKSSSAFSPALFGVKASLFPYRSFQLSLNYSHGEGPNLFGYGKSSSNNYGAEFRYRGNRRFPTFRIAYQYGDYRGPGYDQNWGNLELTGNQNLGRTNYSFDAYRWEYGSGGGPTSSSEGLWFNAQTQLNQNWNLVSQLNYGQGASMWGVQVNETLSGAFGPWSSNSYAQVSAGSSDAGSQQGAGVGQSIGWTSGRFSAFTAISAQTLKLPITEVLGGGSSRSTYASVYVGGGYNFWKAWTVSADLSFARASGVGARDVPIHGSEWTGHVGVTNGGSLPAAIRNTLFYFSNLSYDRAYRMEYPPGYVPNEMAQDILQRRIRQSGAFQFSADYWHSETSGGGTLDSARLNGTLRAGTGFYTQFLGNWQRNRGFLAYWSDMQAMEHYDVSLFATWTLPRSALNLGVGVSNDDGTGPAYARGARKAYFYNAGFYSSLGPMSYGLLFRHLDQRDGLATTTYTIQDSLVWRQVGFRVIYDYNVREDGMKWSRLSVDLLRAFNRWFLPLFRR